MGVNVEQGIRFFHLESAYFDMWDDETAGIILGYDVRTAIAHSSAASLVQGVEVRTESEFDMELLEMPARWILFEIAMSELEQFSDDALDWMVTEVHEGAGDTFITDQLTEVTTQAIVGSWDKVEELYKPNLRNAHTIGCAMYENLMSSVQLLEHVLKRPATMGRLGPKREAMLKHFRKPKNDN